MKKFFSVFLVLLICVTATAAPTPSAGYQTVPLEAALAAVQRHMALPGAFYYSLERDPEENWLIFVDSSPGQGWEHLCYTVEYPKFMKTGVDPESFLVNPIKHMLPPDGTLTPLYVLLPFKTNIDHRPYVKKASLNEIQLEEGARTYAVIINGGGTTTMNNERYWNDCSFVYQTLTNRFGVPKKNIYPVMANGGDSQDNMSSYEGKNNNPTHRP